MSDVIRLNINKKNIRAFVPDSDDDISRFIEVPEMNEAISQETILNEKLEQEFVRGTEEGRLSIKEELDKKHSEELLRQSEAFYKILASFEEKIISYEQEFHKIVLKVSQQIAEKILKREIENKSIIEGTLKDALHKIIGANEILIRINSDDIKNISKIGKDNIFNSGFSKIKFEEDDNIVKGGCVIETEIGNLDARISTQINEIIKLLENNLINSETE